jgi:hypothetical protein
VPHKSNFFFFETSQFEGLQLAKRKLKVETMETPDGRRFYENTVQCFPLWPSDIGQKGRTLGKTYGIKARCYWEHSGGTHGEPWEHILDLLTFNSVVTC